MRHKKIHVFTFIFSLIIFGGKEGDCDALHYGSLPDFGQHKVGWGELMCGPTAAANSIYWLSTRYNLPNLLKKKDGSTYQNDQELIEDLAEAMANRIPQNVKDEAGMVDNRDFEHFPGVSITEMWQGKKDFANQRGVSLVHHQPIDWVVDLIADGADKRIENLASGPDYQKLKDYLEDGEDVELFLGAVEKAGDNWYLNDTHIVSFSGYFYNSKIVINDPDSQKPNYNRSAPIDTIINHNNYFEIPYTVVSEQWEIGPLEIDGVHLYTLKGFSNTDNVHYVITGGIAQSPVPEPSSIVLLGSGLIGLAGARRRKFKR